MVWAWYRQRRHTRLLLLRQLDHGLPELHFGVVLGRGQLGVVVLLGFVMIPHWDIAGNLPSLPELKQFVVDTVLTVPFTLFSIMFVQILSPMNIAFRKVEKNPRIATYRAIRANRIAYAILVIAVLFFATSFTFALSHEQALSAKAQNISALALAGSTAAVSAAATTGTAANPAAAAPALAGTASPAAAVPVLAGDATATSAGECETYVIQPSQKTVWQISFYTKHTI